MQKQYISLNAKFYKTSHFKKMRKHNTRVTIPDYVLDTGYENRYFDFDKNFDELVQDKAQILKQKNTASQKSENTIVEFVCALSREQTKEILKSKDGYEKLSQGFKLTMETLQEKYGFTPMSFEFHGDEGHIDKENGKILNNFHAHLVFFNFDFKKQKSVLRNIKKGEWSKMQDIAAQCFQSVRLKYERGEKKTTKMKDHLERADFKEIRENHKNEEIALKNIENGLKETYKTQFDELQAKKNEKDKSIKSLTENFKKLFERKESFLGKPFYTCSEENFDKNLKRLGNTIKSIATKTEEIELKQEILKLNDNIKQFQVNLDEKDKEIQKLKEENRNISLRNSQNLREKTTSQNENYDLKVQNQALTSENKKLEEKNKKLENDNLTLKNDNQTFEKENKRLKNTYEPKPKQETNFSFEEFELNQPVEHKRHRM